MPARHQGVKTRKIEDDRAGVLMDFQILGDPCAAVLTWIKRELCGLPWTGMVDAMLPSMSRSSGHGPHAIATQTNHL